MAENASLLPVQDTVSSAWQKVHGAKGTIWAAILMLLLVSIAFAILIAIGKAISPNLKHVIKFIAQLIQFLLQIGLIYIGVKRALDSPIRYTMVFQTLNISLAAKLIILYILEVIVLLPVMFVFLFLPTLLVAAFEASANAGLIKLFTAFFYLIGILGIIYLSVRMLLSLAYVLDRNMGPWEAIKHSFTATRNNFWRLIAMIIVKVGAILLGVVTLGIGLIWTVPFVTILYGEIYRKLMANAA